MSRSYKKTPIGSVCSSKGQKKFKRDEHQAERTKIKTLLKQHKEIFPHPKEYGNEWASPRDGKVWLGDYKNHSDFKTWLKK